MSIERSEARSELADGRVSIERSEARSELTDGRVSIERSEATDGSVTVWGRQVRLVMTALVLVALLAGTVFGDDVHFPFGPFRMYSTTDRIDAPVNSPESRRLTPLDGRSC